MSEIRRISTRIVALLSALLTLLPMAASALDDPYELDVVEGTVDAAADTARATLEVTNHTGVTARLVGLVLEYDTAGGSIAHFESLPGLDVRVAPSETIREAVELSAEWDEGDYFNWAAPYTVDAAIGADVARLLELADEAGDSPDRIRAALDDVGRWAIALRQSRNRFPELIEALPDGPAWFDFESVGSFQPELEEALCVHLGRRIGRAGSAQSRVDTYMEVTSVLGAYNLYPDCIERDDRMAAARAMVSTDRAQDALVLTERDENGEVVEAWRDIYLAGRLALATVALEGGEMRQFRPGLDSLAEVKRLAPHHPQLEGLENRLLARVARHVDELVAEQQEMEALDAVRTMRATWPDHPEVERASQVVLVALPAFAERSLRSDHPIRANNAYVRGLETLGQLPEWEAVGATIQAARAGDALARARAALDEGGLEAAQEAFEEAQRLAPSNLEGLSGLRDDLSRARWAELATYVEQARYEDALARAEELEADEGIAAVPEEARAEMYLSIAEAIWDRYGLLSGIASRTRLGLAEQALERGRAADPDRAAALSTRFVIARWLFPGLIVVVVMVAAAAFFLRGSWRRRRRAHRLWRRGVELAEKGRQGPASEYLDQAWELVALDDNAAGILGEESRGHAVLRMARVQSERGRPDRVKVLEDEWRLLDDWERPYSERFDEALQQFHA